MSVSLVPAAHAGRGHDGVQEEPASLSPGQASYQLHGCQTVRGPRAARGPWKGGGGRNGEGPPARFPTSTPPLPHTAPHQEDFNLTDCVRVCVLCLPGAFECVTARVAGATRRDALEGGGRGGECIRILKLAMAVLTTSAVR